MMNSTDTKTTSTVNTINNTDTKARVTETDAVAVRIVARSLAREFKNRGYGLRHMVTLANELIGLACETVRTNGSAQAET